VRDHDGRGADVEVAEDHVGRVDGDPDRHGHVEEVGGPDHLLALRLGERTVLGVEEDLVSAAPGEHLHETGGVKPEPRREHGLTGPELVLDPLAAHDRLLGSRGKGAPALESSPTSFGRALRVSPHTSRTVSLSDFGRSRGSSTLE